MTPLVAFIFRKEFSPSHSDIKWTVREGEINFYEDTVFGSIDYKDLSCTPGRGTFPIGGGRYSNIRTAEGSVVIDDYYVTLVDIQATWIAGRGIFFPDGTQVSANKKTGFGGNYGRWYYNGDFTE